MPRSPSRDLVDRFTGNRGYFHRADSLRRWKNGVAFVALGLTLGWLIIEFAWPSRAISAHSHGELANPHAAFDANCEACHKPHSSGDFLSNPGSLLNTHARWHDLTCTKCHSGPSHHAKAKDSAFHEQCSSCHHDHQGRDHSLVRISDSHCTKCHADLPAAHLEGKSNFAGKITGFAKDHPEFKPLTPGVAESGRTLKFSHALHMTPGLVYTANDQHKWTPEELGKQFGPEAKQRFAASDGSTDKPVELNCASCHQLDAGQGVRSEGAYYQAVNFDASCKVCHPLRTPTAVSGGIVVKDFTVPHRQQPDALRPWLRGEFVGRLAIDKNPALAVPLGPGGRLDPREIPEIAKFGSEVDRLTDATMKSLGSTCGKCHYPAGPGKSDVALPNKAMWFEHAKFNHVSHRGLTCASCHPGTEAAFAAGGKVNEREPALIVGVKSCQVCHSAKGTVVELPGGQKADAAGVRHSCTDCHRYHNGDRPLQGMGSPKRDPLTPLHLADWLNGKSQ